MTLIINKVSNGYIIRDYLGREYVFKTLQEVFENLLLRFEGKSKYSNEKSYGDVVINYGETVAN